MNNIGPNTLPYMNIPESVCNFVDSTTTKTIHEPDVWVYVCTNSNQTIHIHPIQFFSLSFFLSWFYKRWQMVFEKIVFLLFSKRNEPIIVVVDDGS